jgi:hypothetical protein
MSEEVQKDVSETTPCTCTSSCCPLDTPIDESDLCECGNEDCDGSCEEDSWLEDDDEEDSWIDEDTCDMCDDPACDGNCEDDSWVEDDDLEDEDLEDEDLEDDGI